MDLISRERIDSDKPSVETLLRAAGAQLWTKRGLQRYMDAEAAKYRPNLLWRINEWKPGLPSVLCLVTMFATVMALWLAPKSWIAIDSVPFDCGVVICAAAFLLLFLGKARGPARWQCYELTDNFYDSGILKRIEHIPDFAYQLTKDIKSLIPEARFRIWPLEQDWVNLDPVLECIVGETGYPVLVWGKNGKTVPPQD